VTKPQHWKKIFHPLPPNKTQITRKELKFQLVILQVVNASGTLTYSVRKTRFSNNFLTLMIRSPGFVFLFQFQGRLSKKDNFKMTHLLVFVVFKKLYCLFKNWLYLNTRVVILTLFVTVLCIDIGVNH
jgi:hypothetical protein